MWWEKLIKLKLQFSLTYFECCWFFNFFNFKILCLLNRDGGHSYVGDILALLSALTDSIFTGNFLINYLLPLNCHSIRIVCVHTHYSIYIHHIIGEIIIYWLHFGLFGVSYNLMYSIFFVILVFFFIFFLSFTKIGSKDRMCPLF